MAGSGERFASAGYLTPKPRILVNGVPMYVRALSSLPLHLFRQVILVVREDVWDLAGLALELQAYFQDLAFRVVAIARPTRGQAETILRAAHLIEPKAGLFVYNCDSIAPSSQSRWHSLAQCQEGSGAIQYFKSSDARYSFVELDDESYVRRVAEKKVLSPYACTGGYYFGRAGAFLDAVERRVRCDVRDEGEFYVGPIYNDLIEHGARIKAFNAKYFVDMGTPEALDRCLHRIKSVEMRASN